MRLLLLIAVLVASAAVAACAAVPSASARATVCFWPGPGPIPNPPPPCNDHPTLSWQQACSIFRVRVLHDRAFRNECRFVRIDPDFAAAPYWP